MPRRGGKRKIVYGVKRSVKSRKSVISSSDKEKTALPTCQSSCDESQFRTLWLDALPQDICCRIAAYITRDRACTLEPEFLNEDALALAEASSMQTNAMAEALDHTPDLRYGDIKLWLQVFENPIYLDAREGRGNAVLHLLARATLRAAQISNRGNHYTAIATGNSVTELGIHLERLTESRYTSMLEMLQRLSHLVSLSIFCDPTQTCAFEYIISGQNAYNRLAQACPTLKALHMPCICRTEVDHTPLLKAFPSLRDLTISKPLPEVSLPYLRSRESVVLLSDRESMCRYASKIGAPVTGITFPEPKWSYSGNPTPPFWVKPTTEEEAFLLHNCPGIRELSLLLCPGAETALPQCNLLLSLQLHWDIPEANIDERNHLIRCLDAPIDGRLLRRVCAQPLLQKLELVGKSIGMDDLNAVIQATGKTLRELRVSLMGQPEDALKRLLGIMSAIVLHNDKLQRLIVLEPRWIHWKKRNRRFSGVNDDAKKEFLVQFKHLLRRLQRKNPWFERMSLIESMDDIVSWNDI